jgi:integrase-like protein
VESFWSRLRDELLAVKPFSSLLEAHVRVEDRRIEYNTRSETLTPASVVAAKRRFAAATARRGRLAWTVATVWGARAARVCCEEGLPVAGSYDSQGYREP